MNSISPTPFGAANATATTSPSSAAATPSQPPASLADVAGGAADAARGGTLISSGAAPQLSAVIERLAQAVADLKRVVAAFAARLAARAAVASGGGTTPIQLPAQQTSSATRVSSAALAATDNPVQGGGSLDTNATNRASAIPALVAGQSEQLRMARNQVTYRLINVTGGASGTTFTPPESPAGVQLETYALRDYQRGAHNTQVLEPITGPVQLGGGESLKIITRVRALNPGDYQVNVGGAALNVHVGTQTIESLPMMTWINESEATKRGGSVEAMSGVLSHFGVSATGNSGLTVVSRGKPSPVQYFNASYQAHQRSSPAAAAREIMNAQAKAAQANPGAEFWVQVADEWDQDAASAQTTANWIAQVKQILRQSGSNAKLFCAAQAKPANLVYASVVDGWATTQSSAGRSRDTSIADIQRAAAAYGNHIELMEYPGNRFFDGSTPGSGVVSTASAALDGASSWFLYSANNLSTLESGQGVEGRGDIGGLVVVDGGRVLPTIALMEAEFGANLGAAARSFGATATSGASQVDYAGQILDSDRASGTPDLRAWEAQIGALIR